MNTAVFLTYLAVTAAASPCGTMKDKRHVENIGILSIASGHDSSIEVNNGVISKNGYILGVIAQPSESLLDFPISLRRCMVVSIVINEQTKESDFSILYSRLRRRSNALVVSIQGVPKHWAHKNNYKIESIDARSIKIGRNTISFLSSITTNAFTCFDCDISINLNESIATHGLAIDLTLSRLSKKAKKELCNGGNMTSIHVDEEYNECILQNIEKYPKFTSLNFSDTSFSDENLVKVHNIRNLKSVSLARTLITTKSLYLLMKARELKDLDLSATNVSGNTLTEILSSFSRLESLTIDGIKIDNGEQFLKELNGLNKLKYLSVCGVEIGHKLILHYQQSHKQVHVNHCFNY
ncbi:MAG: hypothetical protein GY822_20800 [Deltaproteobacteria bacterium]|nr:hypothetical protein [Deltaproteobacteria bacterium]